MGVLGGVLLLALGAWLAGDAVLDGTGRTPWLALALLLLGAPLVIAFSLRPVVYVSDTRMLVRNPFRTITIPWAKIERIEARFSTEVVADGTKYQLWSVPVSMRARKRADRRAAQAAMPAGSGGLFGRRQPTMDPYGGVPPTRSRPVDDSLASSDQAVEDFRELAERHATEPGADGPVTIRWAYEVMAPAVLGAIAVIVLAAV
jgi:hypothetical protein